MNIEKTKKISIIDFLKKEGFSVSRVSGDNYWYLSPLHNEKTASFKVSKKGNVWYDYAKNDGGDIIRQEKTRLSPSDTPDDIATKVHALEKEYFPKTILELLKNKE